jgi:general secretion pathway protein G
MKRAAPHGFTLIELVVTATIVAVLALAVLPLAENTARRAREAELRSALRELRQAIDAYKKAWDEGRIEHRLDDSGYPPSLEALVEGVRDPKDVRGRRQYFLRRIPRDPFADPALAAAAAWGKRSYLSEPDFPTDGADVFDVYSRAEGAGLNGVAYRQW